MKIDIGIGGIPLSAIAAYVGGEMYGQDNVVTSIATDSREVSEGTLFLGIRGERVDGNDYLSSAFRGGASAALGERYSADGSLVRAEDTVKALGDLAKAIKATIPAKTVAVTGSVGKTTTKELIRAVLSARYKTYASKGNHNSNIGLPMSILEMQPDSEMAVFELGMSGLGEIDYLSRMTEPDIGVITNIGVAHMEALGSKENICKAKLELLNGMKAGSILLLNGDDPYLRIGGRIAEQRGIRVLYVSVASGDDGFGGESDYANFRAENLRFSAEGTLFDLVTKERRYADLRIPMIGHHSAYAALFALGVGILSGLDEDALRSGLEAFRSEPLRQSVERVGGVTVIADCYNASPESMSAGMNVLRLLAKQQAHGRRVAVLGDMRELGSNSPEMHAEVGYRAAKDGIDRIYTFGEISSLALREGAIIGGMAEDQVISFPDSEHPEEVAVSLKSYLEDGDVLLIKASRALRAERILAELKMLYENS